MDTFIVMAALSFFVVLWILAVCALVSVARIPDIRWSYARRSKAVTFVMIVLTGGFGSVLYWLRIRPELLRATDEGPASLTRAQRRAAEAYRSGGR